MRSALGITDSADGVNKGEHYRYLLREPLLQTLPLAPVKCQSIKLAQSITANFFVCN